MRIEYTEKRTIRGLLFNILKGTGLWIVRRESRSQEDVDGCDWGGNRLLFWVPEWFILVYHESAVIWLNKLNVFRLWIVDRFVLFEQIFQTFYI